MSQGPSYEPITAPEPRELEERDFRPIHPRGRWREVARKLWAPIAGLGLLLWKLKVLGFVFKFKLFTTIGSMLVSVAAYALLWPWQFAAGLVALLLVHELGHVLAARRHGIPVSAPFFVPFLGAAVLLRELPKNAWIDAQVALAGPIVGGLGAAAVWAAGEASGSEVLVALGFTGFLLNLFNLLPVPPLDGSGAARAIGLGSLWRRLRGQPAGAEGDLPAGQRAAVAAVYLGLALLFAAGMVAAHVPQDRL